MTRSSLQQLGGWKMMQRVAQCVCGSLRAITTGDPALVYVCHCRECQRRTGSVLHAGASFMKTQVRVEGPSTVFARVGNRVAYCASTSVRRADRRSSGMQTSSRIASGWPSVALPTLVFRPLLCRSGRRGCMTGSVCRPTSHGTNRHLRKGRRPGRGHLLVARTPCARLFLLRRLGPFCTASRTLGVLSGMWLEMG
jgi:Glutathione-dependent formaldehyde-activating enzyme